ncbi:hypothetical protein Tco_0185141 [Tanacetum coccineum]
MVAAGGNFMRKTPQEAYDLIENITQHYFQWDAEVYYDTTTSDEPSEAKKSKINPLIRGPSDTFLMGDKEIKFNPLKDIDDPVPIPRVSEKPLDSLDPVLKTFVMTITNPLFDFDSKFTLNLDNPIFDIQNEESDEPETETIIDEVQIHSSQSTAQIPPPIPSDESKVHIKVLSVLWENRIPFPDGSFPLTQKLKDHTT